MVFVIVTNLMSPPAFLPNPTSTLSSRSWRRDVASVEYWMMAQSWTPTPGLLRSGSHRLVPKYQSTTRALLCPDNGSSLKQAFLSTSTRLQRILKFWSGRKLFKIMQMTVGSRYPRWRGIQNTIPEIINMTLPWWSWRLGSWIQSPTPRMWSMTPSDPSVCLTMQVKKTTFNMINYIVIINYLRKHYLTQDF